MALVSKYNLILIFLGQLKESKITFYNNPTSMIQIKDRKIIIYIRKNWNFFILNLVMPKKIIKINYKNLISYTIVLKKQKHFIYLISKNRKIIIKYYKLRYISNIRVIRASILINDIDL